MIVVTRLNGGMFGVNPDLIQRVDSAPDTILTLIDGTKLIVEESMDEVIARVNEHRARVLARSRELQSLAAETVRAVPRRLPDPDDDPDDDSDDPEPDPDDPPTASTGQLRRVR
ncbi:MAG TPA: flagellar FlbD family protein [Cellulomonas sp.]